MNLGVPIHLSIHPIGNFIEIGPKIVKNNPGMGFWDIFVELLHYILKLV